jgi:GTP-binding protein Era
MDVKENFKAGYVSVAGLPNVGKSTLLNQIMGSKLAIVSPKPQTTRGVMRCIFTTDEAQIIFLDTAGMHKPQDSLGEFMVDSVFKSFKDADVIYLIVECLKPKKHEIELIEKVKSQNKTTFLIVNKVDLVKKEELLPIIEYYRSIMDFEEIFPVSALNGDNVDALLKETVSRMPFSPAYYPDDIVSDQIERDFISEFIREKVYNNTREEIPYSSAVVVEDMTERENGGAYISATIYLEKDSQKGILVGKGGSMIKKIGRDARFEIERFMGFKVYLELQVKVKPKWRKDIKSLRKLGYK